MDCPKRRSAVASDLPEDPFVEILARVPARSLCRSKCVAKAWRDIIEDPFHRKKLPQTLQGFFSFPRDTCTGLHIGYVSVLARSDRLQIDPSLSFLSKLPGFEGLTFLDSCNGLLVFEHIDKSLGYVVCNPTTKQWGTVPRCGSPPSSMTYHTGTTFMYLVFDPAVSSHFHLVQFVRGWEDDDDDDSNDNDEVSTSVNVYSSESGQWIHPKSDWYKHDLEEWKNGITRAWMMHWSESSYVAQSQGRLHYINKTIRGQRLSIWVLEDYDDTQKWVLKHSVNFMKLFAGRMSGRQSRRGHKKDYSVVAMHPDGNVVFLVQDWNQKLISYDMDHKLVNDIGTLENGTSTMDVVPYVPCFLESPALTYTL